MSPAKAAGGGEDGAPCLIGEGELGTGKEETGEDNRLEMRGSFLRDGAEKLRHAEAGPCPAEDGEAAVVEGVGQGGAERGDER